jgi:bifunctional protein TilS/HprT
MISEGRKVAANKELAYYRAVRQAVAVANCGTELKQALDQIVRAASRAMQAGVSLVLLDSSRTKLIHCSHWGLPQSYIKKGVLAANKSLAEVLSGEPVAITDVKNDSRVQYPELAVKADIASVLGVPLVVNGIVAGTVRVYTREITSFTEQDIDFISTIAGMAAVAIRCGLEQLLPAPRKGIQANSGAAILKRARSVEFAHPSEAEFARILDFYNVEWVYEPRSFLLERDGDRPVEMFTPDFYLPALDLYIELTTLKQNLVTEKNHKIRQLRELYPEIKIFLLYKRDYYRLLAKYGIGPLAQEKGHGISRVLYSREQIQQRVAELGAQLSHDYVDKNPVMVGVLRGVFCFMADLVRQMSVPVGVEFMAISYYNGNNSSGVKITRDMDLAVSGRHVIMVEDIVDTGMTLNYMLNYLRSKQPASLAVCVLLDKRVRRLVDVPLDYVGFQVPDMFLVGYGLDYLEKYRNLPFIGALESESKESPVINE